MKAQSDHPRRPRQGSKDSLHTLDRDEVRDLRTLRKDSDSPYVFVTERGGPLSTDTLAYIVREAGLEAKLDVGAHPHMLRHAAGYFVANGGGGHPPDPRVPRSSGHPAHRPLHRTQPTSVGCCSGEV